MELQDEAMLIDGGKFRYMSKQSTYIRFSIRYIIVISPSTCTCCTTGTSDSNSTVTTTINTRTVNLFGWATIPGTKKPADYILVGSTNNDKIIPLSLLLLDVKRTDVNKALNSDDDYLFGFNKTFAIDRLQSELSCYAVDSENKQIFNLTEF